MFTGLVEAVGELVERKQTSGGFRLRVASSLATELSPGESVAMNGVCLTVILAEDQQIHADVGPETIRATTLGTLARGSLVNLERPLRADGRIGGHFVQGHADAVGYVEDLRAEAEFHWLTVSFPPQLAPFIVHKGSIAVDGVSLTVAGLGGDRFDVQLVPYTMTHTGFHRVQIRDRVNLECDVLGKYVVRAAQAAGLSLVGVLPGQVTH
ncbi:MAG: riboflavin synthase [Vicinamibacterales bacterium]